MRRSIERRPSTAGPRSRRGIVSSPRPPRWSTSWAPASPPASEEDQPMRATTLMLLPGTLVAHPLRAAAQTPFGHACVAQNGVRFCPTRTLAERIPTWDGIPLDGDVTPPPTRDPP